MVLADFQSDSIGSYEREVLHRALEEKPDILLLAGDYLQVRDADAWSEISDQLGRLLRDLHFAALLGVCAVRGNTDPGNWYTIFSGLEVTTFSEIGAVNLEEHNVRITGLAMEDSFRCSIHVESSRHFHICLGHCPNSSLGAVEADLLVAGHTHGG